MREINDGKPAPRTHVETTSCDLSVCAFEASLGAVVADLQVETEMFVQHVLEGFRAKDGELKGETLWFQRLFHVCQ